MEKEGVLVLEPDCPELLAPNLSLFVIFRNSVVERPASPVEVGVRVHQQWLAILRDSTEYLQHIPADQLIISGQVQHEGILTAVGLHCLQSYSHGAHFVLVFQVDIPLLGDIVEVEVLAE